MSEDYKLEILKLTYENLKKEFTDQEAYYKILEEVKTNKLLEGISQKSIDEVVTKPKQLYAIDQLELPENEDGDIYGDEYSDSLNNISFLDQIDNFGWLGDEADRNKLINSRLYSDLVRRKLGSMPEYVKAEIDTHSLHILGRANNPNDWGDRIKQGFF